VTHLGYLNHKQYCPESIGQPVAKTECRVLGETGDELPHEQSGELVMRGPQFMLGYWKEPQATAAALRDGWYHSGDLVSRDANDFYYVRDRLKEMIKYKGFPIAPAEIEGVLLEHPAVRECGVIGRPDSAAGEIPIAFVALRVGFAESAKLKEELCSFVADRLTSYKQPREVSFLNSVPKTASGKILRRELRAQISSNQP
jgi:long-chain acyl-CoA synthetase